MKSILLITFLLISTVTFANEIPAKNIDADFNRLWNYSNPIQTREMFKIHLENSKDKDLDYRLQLKTQIARTHSLVGELDKAHEILNEVNLNLTHETHVARVRYLLERGRTWNSAKRPIEAKILFKAAYFHSNKFNLDFYTVDAAHMVAIAAKDLAEKIEWLEIGIELAKNSENKKVKGWIGVFYNNIGWDLFEAARFEQALDYFIKCREFHLKRGNQSGERIARWSIAKTYRYLNLIEEALQIQLQLLAEANGVDKSGYTYEELAELYLVSGQEDKAKMYFGKAYAILSQLGWMQRDEPERLERLKRLSES